MNTMEPDYQQSTLISVSPSHQMYKCEFKRHRLSIKHKLIFLKYLGVNAQFLEEPETHADFIRIMCNELNKIAFTESTTEWIQLLNYWISYVESNGEQQIASTKLKFTELDKNLQRIIMDYKQLKNISSKQLTYILNCLEDSTNGTQVWTSIRQNLDRLCNVRKSETEWEQIFLSLCHNLLAKQALCIELLKKNTLQTNIRCLKFSKIEKRLLNYIKKNKIPNVSDNNNKTNDGDADGDVDGDGDIDVLVVVEDEDEEMEKEKLTYLTRCRVCLINEKNMKYIFDNNNNNNNNNNVEYENDEYSENPHRISIGEKFNQCINDSTTIDKNDGYPQYICCNCLILLDNAYSFKMLYEKSHKTLLQLSKLNTLDDIKILDDVSNSPEVDSEQQLQPEEDEELDEEEEAMESEVENVSDSENGNETELDRFDQESRHITHEEYTICLNDYESYNCEELNDNIIMADGETIDPEYLDDIDLNDDADEENNIKEITKINKKKDKLTKEKINLQCETCGIISKNVSSLKMHKKSHSNCKPHQCQVCGKEFRTSVSLKVHIRSHTGERPYVCETCGKAFKTCSAVTNHRAIHTNVKEFKCPHCSYCASTKANLKIHDRTHSGVQPYRCRFCPLKFSTASNMHKHTRNIHQKMKTHMCDQCGRSFFSRESARKHTVTHTGLKPYICPECPTSYGWYNGLQKHMKIQHRGVKVPTEKSYFINVKIIDETSS